MNYLLLKQILQSYLLEDIQHRDITSETIFPITERGEVAILAKESGIIAGLDTIAAAYKILDESIETTLFKKDGDVITQGDKIALINGPIQKILTGERVVLNLLQRMSGIATMTRRAVNELNNENIKITDTRKTTPGLRMFEKYAVTCGGGFNHRFGLYDMVMIKDNHISFAGSIEKAVQLIRKKLGPSIKIEVEVETISQVKEAVSQQVDIIMFDNRTPEEIIEMKSFVPEPILTEASGGITLNTLSNYAKTNVNFISLGFLTHSYNALDMSMKMIKK